MEVRPRHPLNDRLARAAAAISLAVTAVLAVRIVAIHKAAVLVMLLPALAGAVLALRTRARPALLAAALVTAVTAVPLLIGGTGLLYIPSILMLAIAAAASPASLRA
ncbi:MAG TPA: hypothetical protein VF382_03510 [Actinomycetota bacterium]